jgi:hypothetical protein
LRDLVTYRPSPSLEGFAALDRLDEALALSRKFDVGALFRNQPMSEQTVRLDRSDAGIALPQSLAQDLATLFVAIEEHVLLARKVIEYRHPSDVGGLRDLVHRHMIEAPLHEEERGGVGDAKPCWPIAHSLGIEVRRECDVNALVQHAHGVDVEWASATGEGHIRCSYLVGCDGGRSPVRKMAGFDFSGSDPTLTMYQALAEVDHPERLLPHGFGYTSSGMFGAILGRVFMLDFSGPPADRQAPVTHEEFESVLRRVSGVDVRVRAFENASRWTDNTRLADTYRRGKVLLAGDAAHVHSPFGGQGMSLGLVDAANLGWKLAMVVRGEMPESLLDTYTAERRPVAEAVLANTLAQAAIMRPDPQSGAMRDIVAKLMQFDDVNRHFGEMMSGLSIRYDLGSDLDDVGRLIDDKPIGQGVSLYDIMQDGMGVLLDASNDEKASKPVAATTQKIRCVAVDTGPSMLIRADACVAWAGEENSTDGLEEALRRWFIPTLDDGSMVRSEQ